VDPNAEAKIRSNGDYKPFENHTDCLHLLVRATLKYGALRGSSEVSFCFFYYLNFTQKYSFSYLFFNFFSAL